MEYMEQKMDELIEGGIHRKDELEAHEAEKSNYLKYRGKCKEFCERAVAEDPTLTMVRGHYFCPIWGTEEQHWWCKKPDGTIVDPTVKQFPSAGVGIYTEFDGFITCDQCEKMDVPEDEAIHYSNYSFCSTACQMRFVGL